MIRHIIICHLFLLFLCYNAFATDATIKRNINWSGIKTLTFSENKDVEVLYFQGAKYDDSSSLPYFSERLNVNSSDVKYKVSLENVIYEEITSDIIKRIKDTIQISNEINVISSFIIERKVPFLSVRFIPVRKNIYSGKFEKITYLEIKISQLSTDESSDNKINSKQKRTYAEHSVLATGSWYKIPVSTTGIYKINYNDLTKAGINVQSLNPKNIRIYGNGGGMLPESNAVFRYDDLVENPIKVVGEDDSKFDTGDFIIFYAKGPHTWTYDTTDNRFHHKSNVYSETSCYFLNTDLGPGKRIQAEKSTDKTANQFISTFDDYIFHETDSLNLMKSGRQWYGEVFDLLTTHSFRYNFPNMITATPVYIRADVAAKSGDSSEFTLTVNDGIYHVSLGSVDPNSSETDYAKSKQINLTYSASTSDIDLNFSYDKPTSSSIGWLNFFEINVIRNLVFNNGQLIFRNAKSAGKNNVSEYTLSNAHSGLSIWDISNPVNVRSVETTIKGSNLVFKLATDSLKEFIAFDGSYYHNISSINKIANQDLHSSSQVDMIIVTHPDFSDQAERIAEIHRKKDNLRVLVTSPNLIYNEFSSGSQDITGIRDFIRMIYDRASGTNDLPKYLLLFGDASYDYKNRFNPNTNFVPTYESLNSLVPISSYLTDDYFGLLDEKEGSGANGDVDLGIGRFPVKTAEEAKNAVDKVERYIATKDLAPGNIDPETGKNVITNLAEWKNWICFVADDQDWNMHLGQADNLSDFINTSHKEFNSDKIYFDAYKQVSTPGGQRYPEVTEAINQRVEKGALIVNYTGHGGEVGWAHERVLEVSDISKWTNKYNMPVFITATCEFSRLDDPIRTSAGELVFLNPNGGAIALFTTTRIALSNANASLNMSFYDYAFNKVNGNAYRLGDIMRLSKVDNNSDIPIRNFVLLGDPAIRLAYPNYKVTTISIKNNNVDLQADTIKALTLVKITGQISDDSGNKIKDFNGFVYPTIFDKPTTVTTLGNDPESLPVVNFNIQKNVIYKGKSKVINGEFEFSFVVPKDIGYKYGFGKISYYAASETTDANGYYDNIIVGGSQDSVAADNSGPQIKLYIDNTKFISGGNTGANPLLLVYLNDENGINTTGNGIGHDITAVLDNKSENTYVLNDYYETDLGTFKSGMINYIFSGLSEGLHTLTLKVWDVYNNSSEAQISFNVINSFSVYTYPNPFIPDHPSNQLINNTNFCFKHNYAFNDISIRIRISIFNLTGKLIKSIDQTVSDGYDFKHSDYRSVYNWDGKDDKYNYVLPGIYIYKLNATSKEGLNVTKQGKLVVLQSQK